MTLFNPYNTSQVTLSQTFYHCYADGESEIYKYSKRYRVRDYVRGRVSAHVCSQKGGNIQSLRII